MAWNPPYGHGYPGGRPGRPWRKGLKPWRRRPIRSFRDLEVYQATNLMGTEVLRKVIPLLVDGAGPFRDPLLASALKVPRLLAEADSRRFEGPEGLRLLYGAMAECNQVVVCLDAVREMQVVDLDAAVLEDLVRRYLRTRGRIGRLGKAWREWDKRREEKMGGREAPKEAQASTQACPLCGGLNPADAARCSNCGHCIRCEG